MTIEWTEPPAKKSAGGGRGKYAAFVRELQAHPGQWARLQHEARTAAAAQYLRIKFGCETTTRLAGNGFDVYARWPEAK